MANLKRNLGFWRAYATATGLVVAGSTMVSLGNGFGTIGPAFIVAAFIAMIISILIALSYAELSSILPGSYTSLIFPTMKQAIALYEEEIKALQSIINTVSNKLDCSINQ